MPHGLLFARGLAVNIDDDRVSRGVERTGGKLAIDGGEWIIERIHEDAAHSIDDEHARTVPGIDNRHAAAWRAGRKVDRPQQLRRALDKDERLLLIPGMIAAGDHVATGIDKFCVDGLRDTETAGRIFPIHGNEVELPIAQQARQSLEQDGAAATTDNVADEEYAHCLCRLTANDLTLREHEVEAGVARRRRHVRNFLHGEGDANGEHFLLCAQRGNGQVVIAASIADAMAAAIKGEQRHKQNVGQHFGSFRSGLADAPDAGAQRIAKGEGAHCQRLAAPANHRQRELSTGVRQLSHQRDRVDLVL